MTIRELAALAGVSRTTVSYGLKNDPRVSPKTCARIQALAREHARTAREDLKRILSSDQSFAAAMPALALVAAGHDEG